MSFRQIGFNKNVNSYILVVLSIIPKPRRGKQSQSSPKLPFILVVMQWVWKSLCQMVGLGFGQSGSGSGRVFAEFEFGLGFYTVGFWVFVGFLICAKKWQIKKNYNFEKKITFFFYFFKQVYDNFQKKLFKKKKGLKIDLFMY